MGSLRRLYLTRVIRWLERKGNTFFFFANDLSETADKRNWAEKGFSQLFLWICSQDKGNRQHWESARESLSLSIPGRWGLITHKYCVFGTVTGSFTPLQTTFPLSLVGTNLDSSPGWQHNHKTQPTLRKCSENPGIS